MMASSACASGPVSEAVDILPAGILDSIHPLPGTERPCHDLHTLERMARKRCESLPAHTKALVDSVLIYASPKELRILGAVRTRTGVERVAGIPAPGSPDLILPVYRPFWILPLTSGPEIPSEFDLYLDLPGERLARELFARADVHWHQHPRPKDICNGLKWTVAEGRFQDATHLGLIIGTRNEQDSPFSPVNIRMNKMHASADALAFLMASWIALPHDLYMMISNELPGLHKDPSSYSPQVQEAWDLHDAILVPPRILARVVQHLGLQDSKQGGCPSEKKINSLAARLRIPADTILRRLGALKEIPFLTNRGRPA